VLFAGELGLYRRGAGRAWAFSNLRGYLFGETAAPAICARGPAGIALALLASVLTAFLAVGALRMVVAGARRR
jgi:hypothetical protein